MHWDWDGKGKCSCKFPSITSMTVGNGIRLAAILYTCLNQIAKARNWIVSLFLVGNGKNAAKISGNWNSVIKNTIGNGKTKS